MMAHAEARDRNAEQDGMETFGHDQEAALPAEIIRRQIEQIREEDKLTQVRIAAAAGLHDSALSSFLKGTYKADDSRVRQKLTNWLRIRDMKATIPKPDYVETAICRQYAWVCSRAHANGVLGLIIGPSGVGKDMAIYEYRRRTGPAVVIVECDGLSAGKYSILRETARALDLRSAVDAKNGYSAQDMRDAVIEKLAASRAAGGGGILLVYNEVHLVDYHAVEMIRRLLDKSGCGGVLVGTSRLSIQLSGRGKLMYEQIRRRCHAVRAFAQADRVDEEDVRAVAESVAGRKCSKSVIGLLLAEANSEEPGHLGKLGRVAALVHQAMDLAQGSSAITCEDVEGAAKLLAA